MKIDIDLIPFNILPTLSIRYLSGSIVGTGFGNNIPKAIDEEKLTIVVLLDYSKAVDTLNHQLILSILLNVGQSAIQLFSQYLSPKIQTVKINGKNS